MRSGPWDLRASYRLVVMNVVAGCAVAVGWFVVAGEVAAQEQVTWVGLGAAGLVVALFTNARFILEGRRAVGEALRDTAASLTPVVHAGTPDVGTAEAASVGGYVAGPGLLRYHRASCTMATGRGWPVRALDEVQDGTRLPCGVCRP